MKLSESKPAAVGAMLLVVIVIVLTFTLRPVWWAFIDEFFLFMTAFTHLVSVFIVKYNLNAARKLRTFTIVFAILMVVSLIGEYIAFQVLEPVA